MPFLRPIPFVLLAGSACTSSKVETEDDTGLEPTSGVFDVLTYNVHGLPSAITGDDTPGRMQAIAPRLTAHRIIGLQEDFDADNHAILTEEAPHLTQITFDQRLDGRFYGSGLTILADYEEIEVRNTHYSTCHGTTDAASDCLASKGFQALRVQLGTATLDIYNTHLEAGGGDEDNAARQVQVDDLIASLQGWSQDQAVVFTGDFNLRETDPEDLPQIDQLLEEAGLERTCWALDCDTPNHIDKILFRSSPEVTLVPTLWANIDSEFRDESDTPLSDHPPIAAAFAWHASSGSQPQDP